MKTLTVIDSSVAFDPPRPASVAGLYVHVPFCFHKCHYCDFYSITRQTPARMSAFVDRLLVEADGYAGLGVDTIFFGGGTPSLLPLDDMRQLLVGLGERLDLSAVREWTVEVNPATADGTYLRMMRDHGVDRVSFGAQSFDRDDLANLERHHDPDDVPRSVELARSAGYERWSIDLIYAVPGQTLASWERTLAAALELRPRHLSCYGLTYEPNTPLGVRQRLGQVDAAEESLELQMLWHTRRTLTDAGLPPYEISNYAAPGHESLHNLHYWHGENYIGLGPSAASHVDGTRWRNAPHIGKWERGIDTVGHAAIDAERLDRDARASERTWLALRTAAGLCWDELDLRHSHADTIDMLTKRGLLVADEDGMRLTDTGIPLADAIAAEFFGDD
ncbi:MAG: radical SAM family heme chaperone HemW [Planctomycetota bacterium]